jgi:beclin
MEVGWDEINQALGQVVYLLCVLAHRMHYSFEKHVLHVNGAFSKISLEQQRNIKYELYYVYNDSNFNKGMQLLLECIAGFMAFVQPMEQDLVKQDRIKKCAIVGDKIDSQSIIYKQDAKEQWTRACKCMLTNLQYLATISKLRDESA